MDGKLVMVDIGILPFEDLVAMIEKNSI